MKENTKKGVTRREFLGLSALGLASLTILPSWAVNGVRIAPSDRVVLGFVGLGQQGLSDFRSRQRVESLPELVLFRQEEFRQCSFLPARRQGAVAGVAQHHVDGAFAGRLRQRIPYRFRERQHAPRPLEPLLGTEEILGQCGEIRFHQRRNEHETGFRRGNGVDLLRPHPDDQRDEIQGQLLGEGFGKRQSALHLQLEQSAAFRQPSADQSAAQGLRD